MAALIVGVTVFAVVAEYGADADADADVGADGLVLVAVVLHVAVVVYVLAAFEDPLL